MKSIHSDRLIVLAVAFTTLLMAANSYAADATWTGETSTAWNAAGNWTITPSGTVPVNGDVLVFNATPTNQPSNNNISNLTVSNINFDAFAGTHTLGGNALHLGWRAVPADLGGTGITYMGDITNNSSVTQTINNAITLDTARHMILTQNGTLNLHGAITQSKASAALFINNLGGTINLTGSGLSNTNGILGGWATIGTSPGLNTANDWATLDGSGNVVPYTAYTEVTDGLGVTPTISDGPSTNVRITAGSTTATTLAAVGDTHINTLLLGPGGSASGLTIGTGNRLVLGQNGGIFNASAGMGNTNRNLTIDTVAGGLGTITAGDGINPATITLSGSIVPTNAGIMNINSNITDNGSAKVSVVLSGGYVTPNAASANTFSGGLYILSGRWSQPNGTSIGEGPVYIFPGGLINPGAGTPVTISNDLFIAGNGSVENNGQGAIRMFQNTNGNATQITGTVTLMADAAINSNGLTQNQISLGRFVGVTGKITGPGGLGLGSPVTNSANGSGIVIIGPTTGAGFANDYAGNTTINGVGGAVTAGLWIGNPDADNIMPHGATGSYAGGPTGNVVLNSTDVSRPAIFDLNGSQQTINGLTNTSTSIASNFVQSAMPGGVLIVGDSNATATFDGNLRDNDLTDFLTGTLAVTKIGTGTQTFTGGYTYTGDTRVNAGTLSLAPTIGAPSPGTVDLGDSADVYIAGGAFLNLSFTGMDTIRSLYLNGTPVAPGVYGSANSSGRITGAGQLMVQMMGMAQTLVGDYNKNGVVDAADYVVWRDAQTAGATSLDNRDPLNSGTVGVSDYNSWRAHFGATGGPGSGSAIGSNDTGTVPEPGTAVLMLVAIVGGMFFGRRGVVTRG